MSDHHYGAGLRELVERDDDLPDGYLEALAKLPKGSVGLIGSEELAELKDWAEPSGGVSELVLGWARATVRKLIRYVEARQKADREREQSPLPTLSAIDCTGWPEDAKDAFIRTNAALKVARRDLRRRGSWEALVEQMIESEFCIHPSHNGLAEGARAVAIKIVAALEGRTA